MLPSPHLLLRHTPLLVGVLSVLVRVSPSEGRRLVEDALSRRQDSRFTLSLRPGPSAFQVTGDRILLNATATLEMGAPLSCPVQITGHPVIRDNRVGLDGADITSDDWSCRTAGAMLRGYAIASLQQGSWDLASQLIRASWDPTDDATPRLEKVECLVPGQVTLRSVSLEANAMVVRVELPDSAVRQRCPD